MQRIHTKCMLESTQQSMIPMHSHTVIATTSTHTHAIVYKCIYCAGKVKYTCKKTPFSLQSWYTCHILIACLKAKETFPCLHTSAARADSGYRCCTWSTSLASSPFLLSFAPLLLAAAAAAKADGSPPPNIDTAPGNFFFWGLASSSLLGTEVAFGAPNSENKSSLSSSENSPPDGGCLGAGCGATGLGVGLTGWKSSSSSNKSSSVSFFAGFTAGTAAAVLGFVGGGEIPNRSSPSFGGNRLQQKREGRRE